jgi:hypothetical protein
VAIAAGRRTAAGRWRRSLSSWRDARTCWPRGGTGKGAAATDSVGALRRGAARGGRDQRVSQSLSCIPKVRRASPFFLFPRPLEFGCLDSHIARGSVY